MAEGKVPNIDDGGSGPLKLKVFLHPTMPIPAQLHKNMGKMVFGVDRRAPVSALMEDCEEAFSLVCSKLDIPLELRINVLWNTKDFKQALNPKESTGMHFVDGYKFGVYGDIEELEDDPPITDDEKIPITILTGFLGAGKTTLLNYILEEQVGQKIAVIENEFGQVAIDDDLLTSGKMKLAEQITSLDNGCMCCTVRGDLEAGLEAIYKKVSGGSPLDAVILETTGMADPVPIVRTIKSLPNISEVFRLDGVVAVADAKNLPKRLSDDVAPGKVNEAYQQVAFADRILLNKIDLVSAEQAIAVKDTMRNINKFAKIIPSVRGRVDLTAILNLRANSLATLAEAPMNASADAPDDPFRGEPCVPDRPDVPVTKIGRLKTKALNLAQAFSGKENQKNSRHDNRVGSFAIVQEGEMDCALVPRLLGSLQGQPKDKGTLFRFKGILAIKNNPQKFVVHAVMDVVDDAMMGSWKEDEQRVCKMVFIGKDLDEAHYRGVFERILGLSKTYHSL